MALKCKAVATSASKIFKGSKRKAEAAANEAPEVEEREEEEEDEEQEAELSKDRGCIPKLIDPIQSPSLSCIDTNGFAHPF